MVELITIALLLYALVRLGVGILQDMEDGLATESPLAGNSVTAQTQEAVLSRHRAALGFAGDPELGIVDSVLLVLETDAGTVRAPLLDLTALGACIARSPELHDVAGLRRGGIEIGGEWYLDLDLVPASPSPWPGDAVVVVGFAPLAKTDANALARLIGACTRRRLAA